MTIHLTTANSAEERIKAYLEENASAMLADKINHGVFIQKDGKRLLNRKNLSGFMKYATTEAKKLAEKGASFACIEDATVYGWAIHYFEEDCIEGTLYNEDGSEYKAPVPERKTPTYTPPAPAKPKPQPQMSLFELMTQNTAPVPEEPTEEVQEVLEMEEQKEITPPKQSLSPSYQNYLHIQSKYPDAIVAYRLGDFYEVFGDHAKLIARELDLTLTGRDCGLPERIPMIGFPYHAADLYIRKMIEKGFTVAIANGKEDIRISTPSSDDIVDDDLTEEEMREFDVDGNKHWIDDKTYADSDGEIHSTDDDAELAKAFDVEAVAILDELLGNLLALR